MRAGGALPDPATPADYERILRPIYGFAFGLAEAGLARGATRPSERAWRSLSGSRRNRGRARQATIKAAIGGGVPASVWPLNRLLRASFDPDLSAGGDHPQRHRRRHRGGPPPAHRRRPHDHRPHPPRRPRRGARRVAAARRRPSPQHRQLGLRRRLPPPRRTAQPLLAGNRHLGRGRRARRVACASWSTAPRGAARRGQRRATRR